MTMMRRVLTCFLSMLLLFGFSGCAKAEPEQPENVEIHFFYNQPCASCDGTKELFEIVSEELEDVSDLYPYYVSVYNVFRKEDAQIRDSELKKLGFQEELAGSLTYPIMTLNGNIYFGIDSIRSSIREAYLTAGEDLFVYGRGVYDPTEKLTLKQQLADYKLEKGSSSVVYFYRSVCEECIKTSEEVLDSFPETVVVDGTSYPQQIIKINTRSGRNTEILQAFFDKYEVPLEDQMVPIVFTAQGYLAGYDAISSDLYPEMEKGAGLGMKYPEEKGMFN
ncbi:hypothetical protein [Eisenbergiella sp.]